MNRLAALLLLCPVLLCAGPVTKLIRLQYADPDKVANLMNAGTGDHPLFHVVGDNTLKAVLVKGDDSTIASIEQTIKEMDVPAAANVGRDVELVIYVIGASSNPQESPQSMQEIEPVVKQLKGIFPFASYRLLDTMLMRSAEHRLASTQGVMRAVYEKSSSPQSYMISFGDLTVNSEGAKRSVHLQGFRFQTRVVLVPTSGEDLVVRADVDLREGQKAVVGNTDVGGDSALFVVLTARVLD